MSRTTQHSIDIEAVNQNEPAAPDAGNALASQPRPTRVLGTEPEFFGEFADGAPATDRTRRLFSLGFTTASHDANSATGSAGNNVAILVRRQRASLAFSSFVGGGPVR